MDIKGWLLWPFVGPDKKGREVVKSVNIAELKNRLSGISKRCQGRRGNPGSGSQSAGRSYCPACTFTRRRRGAAGPCLTRKNSAWGRVFLMNPCGNCRRRGFRMLLCAAQSITSVMKTKSARKKQSPITAFWTQALVPLCCFQPQSALARHAARSYSRQVVWWATVIEAVSSLNPPYS